MRRVILLASVIGAVQAHAGFKKSTKQIKYEIAPIEEHYLPFNDNKFYSEILKKEKSELRKPSSAKSKTDVTYDDILAKDKDFVELRNKLIGDGSKSKGVQNANSLQAIIMEYSNPTKYSSLSLPAKLVALQLRALAPFRGFIFRARQYTGRVSAARTMIVSMLNAQMSGINMLFPFTASANNQWEVVFRYITEPTPDIEFEISTDETLYRAYTHIASELSKVHNDFGEIAKNTSAEIWWDNKMFMAFSNMPVSNDRFIKLGFVELNAMYSGFSLALSSLYSTIAYTFTGLQEVLKSNGHFFGIGITMNDLSLDGDIFNPNVNFNSLKSKMENGTLNMNSFANLGGDGFTSFARIGILNSHPELFKLNGNYGRDAMEKAYRYLVTSARSANAAFITSQNPSNNSDNSYLFDSRVAQVFQRTVGTSLSNLQTLITGMNAVNDTKTIVKCDAEAPPSTMDSVLISNERITMNIAGFYCNPPESLSELYPQDWETGIKYTKISAWGQMKSVRNYKYGMATAWKTSAYQKIFPEITTTRTVTRNGKPVDVTSDVAKYNRILLQTWGGVAFALPISAVMF